jgi:WD40 repeat protein
MAKEPGRRYPTGRDLADDLRRYLKGEPIQARPVGRLERAWRWARRRPAVAGLLALLLLVLAIGLPAVTVLWLQADAARKNVEKERDATARAKEQTERDRDALARAKVQAEKDAQTVARAKDDAEKGRAEAGRHLYGTRAALIQTAWRNRALGRVRQLLDLQVPKDGEPDLRGFEWHYYRRLLEGSQVTLVGHADTVTAVDFSPDRRHLASGSADGTAKVWELATRLELASFPGHGGGVVGVALAPGARRLAAVGRDGTVHVWNPVTGKEVFHLAKQTPTPGGLAYSPDGQLLAVAGDPKVSVRDDTGKEVFSFAGHGKAVTAVTFSADGQRVASAGADGTVRVWEASSSGKQQGLLRVGYQVVRLTFTTNGQFLILSTPRGGIAAWHVASGRHEPIAPEHNRPTALSRDGRQVARLVEADTVRVLDLATSRELFALRRHAGPITQIVYSPDGALVATASRDRTVKVWTASFELDVLELHDHVGEVYAVVFSPDGKHLATGGADGTLWVREPATGQADILLQAHVPIPGTAMAPDQSHKLQGISALAYSRDGLRIASGGADGTVKTWDANTGKLLRAIQAHFVSGRRGLEPRAVTGVAFSPDGRLLASSSWDRTVKVWDAATGRLVHTLAGHRREVSRVAFSPDGTQIASSSWDQRIRLWSTATGKEVRSFPWVSRPGWVEPVESLAFHPEGKYLAAAPDRLGGDGEVRVFDLATGAARHSLAGHIYGIFQVVFGKDGRRLASCSCDGGLKVWDMATGQEVFSYHNHTGLPPGVESRLDSTRDALHSVALSPDGLRLAVGCRNSNVLVLDATPATPEQLVGREAYRIVKLLYEEQVTRSAVLEHLASSPSRPLPPSTTPRIAAGASALSRPLLAEARARAERYRQDPGRLNNLSWSVVRQPRAAEAAYRRALLQAEEACRLAPGNGMLLNTLGVARYRTAQYQAAVEALTASDKAQSPQPNGSLAADLAFLAMAHHQLGQKPKAQAALDRLRETMKQPRWARDPEARAFLQEAELLLHAKTADGKK